MKLMYNLSAPILNKAKALMNKFSFNATNHPLSRPGIYRITNLINHKIYIGISKNIKKRAAEHARNKFALGNAISKYGCSNFLFEPIFYCINTCDTFFLPALEAEKIMELNSIANGYNIIEASGRVGPYGKVFSQKITDAHQRKTSEERSHIARKGKASMSKELKSSVGRNNAISVGLDELSKRMKIIRLSQTPERRKEIASMAGKASNSKKSPEQKRATALRMTEVWLANTTPEGRRNNFLSKSPIARLSKEQLSANGSKGAAKLNARLTPEQRSESARKAALAGVAKRAAMKLNSSTPAQ
jgi:group I intron endonuclease